MIQIGPALVKAGWNPILCYLLKYYDCDPMTIPNMLHSMTTVV